jgi:hypothetical protein
MEEDHCHRQASDPNQFGQPHREDKNGFQALKVKSSIIIRNKPAQRERTAIKS